MLAAHNRLTSREDFVRTTKSPIRATTDSLIGYLLLDDKLTSPKIGFIVTRTLGGAVTRHRVSRQLRHAARNSLHTLPRNCTVVVRAKKKSHTTDELSLLFKNLTSKSETKMVNV